MSKTLVIVESPAKAKTISKYLGSDYIVKSSVGHIRDLPKGKSKKPTQRNTIPKDLPEDEKRRLKKINERKRLIRRMGIDPDNGWLANYEILASAKSTKIQPNPAIFSKFHQIPANCFKVLQTPANC